MKLKCIKRVTILGTSLVCIQCRKDNEEDTTELNEAIEGFCPKCIEKFKMDSVKNTVWELKF